MGTEPQFAEFEQVWTCGSQGSAWNESTVLTTTQFEIPVLLVSQPDLPAENIDVRLDMCDDSPALIKKGGECFGCVWCRQICWTREVCAPATEGARNKARSQIAT